MEHFMKSPIYDGSGLTGADLLTVIFIAFAVAMVINLCHNTFDDHGRGKK